jgi:hypothetical protein
MMSAKRRLARQQKTVRKVLTVDLTGRGTSHPAHPIPSEVEKARYAEAVHRAVCEVTESDGFARCMQYAVAGFGLLADAGYILQAGSLAIIADETDPTMAMLMDASNGGFDRAEGHCWLARQNGSDCEIVDFAARHYRRYCEDMMIVEDVQMMPAGCIFHIDTDPTHKAKWNRADPPAYYWEPRGSINAIARFKADPEACQALVDRMIATKEYSKRLVNVARRHFRELTGQVA